MKKWYDRSQFPQQSVFMHVHICYLVQLQPYCHPLFSAPTRRLSSYAFLPVHHCSRQWEAFEGFYLSFFGKGFRITHAGLKLAVQARMTVEFLIFPSLPPKCWNHKLAPSCPAPLKMFFFKAECHWKHKNKTEQNELTGVSWRIH